MLNRLFTSRIRTKLLQFFLNMPESSFYIRELERKINEDAKNISRELTNLEEIEFVKSEKRGNLKFYTANKAFLFYPELRALFLKSFGPSRLFREKFLNIDSLEAVFWKEVPAAEEGRAREIKLVLIGKPDMTIVNDTINSLMAVTGFDISYRCFDREEFEERQKMGDASVNDAMSGERIF